jgi:hypothetical protein
MKSVLPALLLVLFFASCTTAYKSGQTPDDVYFSPQHPQDEYVRVENKQDKYQYNGQNEDDRYLRMKVRNRQMWSDLDYYYSDPLAYRYYNTISPSYYYSNPWNYYNSWNYYYNPYAYNPYASKIIVVNPKNPVYNRPRMTNLNVYDDVRNNNNSDQPAYNGKTRVFGTYSSEGNSNSPRRSNAGESLRNIFNNNNSSSSSSSSNNTPARTTTPSTNTNSSSSSSSGSSGSGSTNAPVRKF